MRLMLSFVGLETTLPFETFFACLCYDPLSYLNINSLNSKFMKDNSVPPNHKRGTE